jgi:lipopolysaccharide/colanic/teichoic acid biosynthesis glycosyltransferase
MEMSWIGPRPLSIEYDTLFTKEQHIRFEVKPGITGWAQINGRHSIN